jgi:hypothetical protein
MYIHKQAAAARQQQIQAAAKLLQKNEYELIQAQLQEKGI